MKREIILTSYLKNRLFGHLFQNRLEQAAFLFAQFEQSTTSLKLTAVDIYAVPPQGWDVQLEVYLQMRDSERAKILKMARDKGLALIDCHSHPHAGSEVWFSPSDIAGITEFASYVKWKLDGKPFAAAVWGENSVDAVVWQGDFNAPYPVDAIQWDWQSVLLPNGSWFDRPKGKNRYEC